jgi:hypothetical protein
MREGNGKLHGHARVIVEIVENAGREFGDSTHLMLDCNLMK